MTDKRIDVPYGSLDLLILKTLDGMGSLHGWGIARRIEQVCDSALRLGQGTLYPALVRLEQDGLIRSKWGVSENGRRARFYSLTARGTRRLPEQIDEWVRATELIAAALGVSR
jgi:PadR family transcriptional regulator, regulatory protein PadR